MQLGRLFQSQLEPFRVPEPDPLHISVNLQSYHRLPHDDFSIAYERPSSILLLRNARLLGGTRVVDVKDNTEPQERTAPTSWHFVDRRLDTMKSLAPFPSRRITDLPLPPSRRWPATQPLPKAHAGQLHNSPDSDPWSLTSLHFLIRPNSVPFIKSDSSRLI
jgi:hypothetical protein